MVSDLAVATMAFLVSAGTRATELGTEAWQTLNPTLNPEPHTPLSIFLNPNL